MAKIIKKATKSPLFLVVMGLIIVAGVGFILIPQIAKAVVGSITFSGVNGSGTGPYDAYGTWAPVQNQKCYNSGSGFRFYIEIFEDTNNNDKYDLGEVVQQVINPAPCGDQFDPNNPPASDLTGGGNWPATGQSPIPVTFNLTAGTHYLCSVLRHVSKQGNDIVSTSCLENPIDILGPEPQVTISKTDNKDYANPGDTSTYEITVKETSGQSKANDVLVEDTVPSYLTNITNISNSGNLIGNVITWTIDLAAGETKVLKYDGTIDPNLSVGTTILVNSAELDCNVIPEVDLLPNHFGAVGYICGYIGSSIDTTSVTVEPLPICGDGNIDEGEQCDDDNLVDGDGCSSICHTEICGNRTIDPGETCDDGNTVSGDGCSSTCTTEAAAPTPTLTLTKIDTPDPVAAGANLTYTLNFTITNASATGIVMTDPIPTNTTFVSASDPGKYDSLTNKVTWSFGTLAAGNYVATLKVKVYSPLANGTKIANKATIDSNETNPLDATAETTASTAPILTMDKLVDKTTASAGDTILYTIKVTNSGTDTAHNVKLTDTLPTGLTFVDNGTTTMTYNFGDIEAGKTVATSYSVKIDASITAGTYTNTATITADNHAKLTDSVSVSVSVPIVLGEEIEKAPVEEVKVLAEEEELPVTGLGIFTFLVSGLILTGTGLFLRKKV